MLQGLSIYRAQFDYMVSHQSLKIPCNIQLLGFSIKAIWK